MTTAAVAFALLLHACATTDARPSREPRSVTPTSRELGPSGGARLWTWPGPPGAAQVLIVAELGFDRRLVTALAERLRARRFSVSTLEGRHLAGADSDWARWSEDVAAAVEVHEPGLRVLALGVGGAAALAAARPPQVAGLVAVNVPARLAIGNLAVADALAEQLFDPHGWLQAGRGAVLLGRGAATPRSALDALAAVARPLPQGLAASVAAALARRSRLPAPAVPVRILVSPRGNLSAGEDAAALLDLQPGTPLRSLGRMELFAEDYGHLEWLVDAAALDDVAPLLAGELEALDG